MDEKEFRVVEEQIRNVDEEIKSLKEDEKESKEEVNEINLEIAGNFDLQSKKILREHFDKVEQRKTILSQQKTILLL